MKKNKKNAAQTDMVTDHTDTRSGETKPRVELAQINASPASAALEKQHVNIENLRIHGIAVRDAVIAVGEKYVNLCRFIRSVHLDPRTVREELTALGFNKTRISEINRVSQCSDELWNEFDARNLAFKDVLQLARGGEIEEPTTINADTGEPENSEPASEGDPDAPNEEEIEERKWNKAAGALIKGAQYFDLRKEKKWTADGFVVSIKLLKGGRGGSTAE